MHSFRWVYFDYSGPGNGVWVDDVSFETGGNLDVANDAEVGGHLTANGAVDVNGPVRLSDGGTRSRNGGIVSEANGTLVDLGMNDDAVNRFGGSYTPADQGGMIRVDTRSNANDPLFQFLARSAGATTSVGELGYITANGTVRFEIGSGQKFSLGGNGDFGIDAPFNPNGRFVVKDSGNVGIRVPAPSNILAVQQNSATDPIADAWTTYSSRRWKTNVHPIHRALGKIQRLNGVRFTWKKTGKPDMGFIAEDVGKVFPGIVTWEKNGRDARGLDYSRLVPVLVQGVKEQQSEIRTLRRQNAALAARMTRLERLMGRDQSAKVRR